MSQREEYTPPVWLRQVINVSDVRAASARTPAPDQWLYGSVNPDKPREEKKPKQKGARR